jgi:GTP:adenosylcobinamide-phosphate guanylyltransferase
LPPERFTAILLAAQRAGEINPLAEAHRVSHKCLVPVAGAALIRHVVRALAETPGIEEVRVSIEPAVVPQVEQALAGLLVRVVYMPAADNLADSVYACADGALSPIVITTADNVLLRPESVLQMLAAIKDADGAIALARRAAVHAAHPDGQRRFYRFSDDAYSNCNLYALAGQRGLRLVESFRSGGQFRKNRRRLIMTLGPFNLLLMLWHRISLVEAGHRIGRRLGITLVPVLLRDGSQAIDVDNPRSHRIAGELLDARSDRLRAAA